MEYMDGVIGSTAAWCGFPADESGIADTAHIQSVFLIVIFAPALSGKFTDAIYRIRVHYTILRGLVFRRVGAKYSNRAWPVYFGRFISNGQV
ncbi:hypothetical protein D3C86_1913600 [compost metagenome]